MSTAHQSTFMLSQSSQRAVHKAIIRHVEEVAPAHYKFKLHAPQLAQSARAGQFVHILTTPATDDWTLDPLLRRAFSIMSVDTSTKEIVEVLFRVAGRGTKNLSMARAGEEINLIGPLGQPFDLSPFEIATMQDDVFHVKQTVPNAITVGGGVGVPPLVYLSQTLQARGVAVHSIIGARTSAEIIGWSELSEVCQQVEITTDDGSKGHKGRVTDLLSSALNAAVKNDAGQRVKPVVYACGPLPMLRAVAQLCAAAGLRCQVSLEENMPCGIGVCNGCVVRTRQPFANERPRPQADITEERIVGTEWSPYRTYRRVCIEGPACWADEIDWEHQG